MNCTSFGFLQIAGCCYKVSVEFIVTNVVMYTVCSMVVFLFQCLSLLLWLEERYETIYMRHPGFQKGSKPLLTLDNPFPMELPENLVGEKWAFVQLPFSGRSSILNGVLTNTRFTFSINLLTTDLFTVCVRIVSHY